MESFYEPIVLKEDSSLDDKLEMLKHFQTTDKIEIDRVEKGIAGEKQVLYHLKKSNIGMYIMRDINLQIDGLKAQIDFIVVTSHHCYFIESKNYSSDIIYIDKNRNFEISTKYKNRYRKQGIKSPLSQADDQLSVFQRLYLKDKENANSIFDKIKFEEFFKTMVVFTNPESRIKNQNAPFDMKYKVLKVDNLINQIKYDEQHYKGTKLSQEQMFEIANYILNNNVKVQIDQTSQVNKYNYYLKNDNEPDYGILALLITSVVMAVIGSLIFLGNNIQNNHKKVILNDNNITAINSLKNSYNNSQKYGFDLYDYNQCINLKEILNDNFSCTGKPIQVTFNGENSLSIYQNNACYYLKYDIKDKKTARSSYKYVGYDKQCPGIDIGLIHYDSSNQFLTKIGGYNKILEMARFAHNNATGFDKYYDYSKISKRGGKEILSTTYKSEVDKYFGTLTNKGYTVGTNTLEDFNKMVEYYYYIMK